MRVALFIGIESFGWSVADFKPAIDLARANNIDTLLVKVFDGMQGEWYNRQFPQIVQLITSSGLAVVPYGFHYGNNKGSSLTGEAELAIKYGQQYGVYCADMESSWDGQGDWAAQLARLIATGQKQKPFDFWVSTWANVGDEAGSHHWLTAISDLAPVTKYFLPQAYSDSLYNLMTLDWAQSKASKVQTQPTFDLSAEFGTNDPVTEYKKFSGGYSPEIISLWEYGFVKPFQSLTTTLIQAIKGTVSTGGGILPMPLNLSPSGCVVDLVKSFQLDGNSQDKCGPWSVSELHHANLPGHGAKATRLDVQSWASEKYIQYIGPDVASDQNGSSIDNMHQFLKDAGLHWWDIAGIVPQSKHSDDIARLHRALDAGYPVLVTINEQSVIRSNGSNPYPWQPRLGPVNHIFTVVGHTRDGYLLVDDELNQGDAWPDKYSEAHIECHWASVVQLVGPDAANPWLKGIPGDDPLTWPAGFNAQNFAVVAPPPLPGVNYMEIQMLNTWNAFFGQLAASASAFGLPMTPAGFAPPPYTTGIAAGWRTIYPKQNFGPAVCFEYDDVDWHGNPIKVQYFLGGIRCEWQVKTSVANFYNATGQKVG